MTIDKTEPADLRWDYIYWTICKLIEKKKENKDKNHDHPSPSYPWPDPQLYETQYNSKRFLQNARRERLAVSCNLSAKKTSKKIYLARLYDM